MATQTTGLLTSQTKTFYDRTLLEAARPTLMYCRWAQKRPIPQRQGKGPINFRRFELLTEKTTPLQEGITPPSDDLTITTVEATPLQYGAWVQVSDVLTWTAIDPVLTETAQIQGVQAGETLDTLCRNILIAGTTVRYAAGRVSRVTVAAGDNINGTELRKLRRTLRTNKAKPIGGYYPMIVSPSTMFDLQAMTEWQNIGQYQRGEDLEKGIVGRLWGFEFYESERAAVATGAGAAGIDVHLSVALGMNAYGSVDINGHSMETITKPLGSGGSTDPLDQRQTSGWKAMYTAVRLNENFIARLEHAVTA